MLNSHFRAILVVLAMAVILPTTAHSESKWLQRREQIDACMAMRKALIEQVHEWMAAVWFASADNSPNGWIDPSVSIAARHYVRDTLRDDFEWKYITITGQNKVDSRDCAELTKTIATRLGHYLDYVIKHEDLPPGR